MGRKRKNNTIRYKLPKDFNPKTLVAIRKLAAAGLNKGHIVRQLKLSHNAFSHYQDVFDAFESGRADLAKQVSKEFVANIGTSYADRVHLAKQLRLFSSSFEVDEIVDVKTAKMALAGAMREFADCNLSGDELESIRKAAVSFVDVTVQTEIAARLEVLEEKLGLL